MHHPKLGGSWEGFASEEVLRYYPVRPEEAYFWSVHNQAELDLLIMKDGQRLGFEIKFGDSPQVTRSMKTSLTDLSLSSLTVIHPGDKTYAMADKIQAVPLAALFSRSVPYDPP